MSFRTAIQTSVLLLVFLLSLPTLRLALLFALRKLSSNGFGSLVLEELQKQLKALEHARFKASIPKRIILVRHGESQANMDSKCYSHTPDRLISLSPQGRQQALEAGEKLRLLVKNESVLFFVSPFARCRETLAQITKAFGNPKQYQVRTNFFDTKTI